MHRSHSRETMKPGMISREFVKKLGRRARKALKKFHGRKTRYFLNRQGED